MGNFIFFNIYHYFFSRKHVTGLFWVKTALRQFHCHWCLNSQNNVSSHRFDGDTVGWMCLVRGINDSPPNVANTVHWTLKYNKVHISPFLYFSIMIINLFIQRERNRERERKGHKSPQFCWLAIRTWNSWLVNTFENFIQCFVVCCFVSHNIFHGKLTLTL